MDSLQELPGHIQSFSGEIDGNIVTTEAAEAKAEANTAHQLLNSAAKLQQTIPELQGDKLWNITGKYQQRNVSTDAIADHPCMSVTFQDCYSTYTMAGGKIFGVTRSNPN
ncbi:hypothetical protein VTP01DRAFT_1623 [Rhizomucor pusillus]|uniref:uncharacterized protein n=1 Tax=Rhizomucor pusillus TaxID=4840 RepID=UPI0037434BD8